MALSGDARAQAESLPELSRKLQELVNTARKAWPGLSLAPETFVPYLAARVAQEGALEAALEDVHAADLFLSCACAHGDPAAMEAFETAYFGEIERATARERKLASSQDDVKQMMREKIFVAREGAPPRIAEYSGRGDLRNWFRVVVVRAVINLVSRGPKEMPAPEEALDALPLLTQDPELSHMKELYREEFRAAFTEAANLLPTRERSLLRYAFSDGLSLEQIAALYGVHRTTAIRWMGRARRGLEAKLRRSLMRRLRISPDEFESVLRLIRSRIELSLSRILGAPEPPRT
jgi:RNA polymerase sigma-70 factor (ECF subfamily)